ncbi:MAG: hypothetical protein HUJ30_08750 [Gammaproteobacteria bacterium]|nr:hypothetical protein [Gammaproteobacteria bacterium]
MSTINGSCSSYATQIMEQGFERVKIENAQIRQQQQLPDAETAAIKIASVVEEGKGQFIDVYV